MGKSKIPLYLILIIMGIAAFGFGVKGVAEVINYNSKWERFKSTAVSTQATIDDISSYHTRGNSHVSVYVKYTDDEGNEYGSGLDRSGEGFETGGTITVYYNKNDPEEIMLEPDIYLERTRKANIFMFVFGSVLIAAGIFAYKRLNR